MDWPQDLAEWSATEAHIEAVLGAAGNCDAAAMFEDCPTEREAAKMLAAYERGMDKLRDLLAKARGEA